MRYLLLAFGAAALSSAAMLSAHPTDIAYQTRGQCEAAFAQFSKFDRKRLVDDLGVFDSYGEAQRTFNEIFACRYVEQVDAWYIVDLRQP